MINYNYLKSSFSYYTIMMLMLHCVLLEDAPDGSLRRANHYKTK